MDLFDNWDAKDTSLAISAVGNLASAWGQYKTDKERNKLLEKQFNYEVEKDKLANEKMAKAQENYDNAFDASLIIDPKKKKKTGDALSDDSEASTIGA